MRSRRAALGVVAETGLIWVLGWGAAYGFWVGVEALGVPRLARGVEPLGLASPRLWGSWGGFVFGFAAVPLVYERFVSRTSLEELGVWGRWDGGRSALRTGIACVALVAWAWGTIVLLYPGATAWGGARFSGLAIGEAVVAAVGEETLFRAVVQRRLSRVLGVWGGMVVAAGLYAFVGHPEAPLVENLVLRVSAGCVFGWVYWRERSLPAAMACHFVADLLVAVPR